MPRSIRWLLWSVGALLALPLLAMIMLKLATLNEFGRRAIERSVSALSAGQVVINQIGGDVFGELTIKHLALLDASGSWLSIDGLLLNWRPSKLLMGELLIEQLHLKHVTLTRLPAIAAVSATPSKPTKVPFAINLRSMLIERVDIAPLLAGQEAYFDLKGQLKLTENLRAEVDLHLQSLNGKDTYNLQGSFSDQALNAHISLQEAAQGLLAKFASLRNQGALKLEAAFDGPLSSVSSHAELKLDGLLVKLAGKIDFVQAGVDLTLAATAPSMQLRQDLGWQALALNMQLQGPLEKLNASGNLQLDRLTVGQTTIGSMAIKLKGRNGLIDLDGAVTDLRLAASTADLLQAVPLAFQAKLGLGMPDYPASFALQHPMMTATGHANDLKGQTQGEMLLTLPNLHSLAALGSLDINGKGSATVKLTQRDADSQLSVTGLLNVKDDKRLAKLLGESAQFAVSIKKQGEDIAASQFHLEGTALTISGKGSVFARKADANWQAQFKDLSAIDPNTAGKLTAQGQLLGDLADLTLSADLKGNLASQGYTSGPLTANLQLKNLPNAPNGRMTVAGELLRSPIDVRLTLASIDPDRLMLVIDKANWKSVHAEGGLMLTQHSSPPVGKIALTIGRFADLQPLVNFPLRGSGKATLESIQPPNGQPLAKLKLEASHFAMDDAVSVDRSELALSISDPLGVAQLKGLLALDGIRSGSINGAAQLALAGRPDALDLRLSADLPKLDGSDARLAGKVLLNTQRRSLRLNTLQASWHKQSMRLLAPATVDFNEGVALDRLRLGLQQAELAVSGRLSPKLALTAELYNTPAQLLSLFVPNVAITGSLHADAQLQGNLQLPTGLIQFNAHKLQLQQGSGKALPPAQINATALLQGENAELKLAVTAGNTVNAHLAGQIPLSSAGQFNLSGNAAVDLKVLDPLLTADGQQLHGQLLMNPTLAGTWSAPLFSGDAQLNHGQWQDYVTGTEIGDITAAITAQAGILQLVKLQARAGPGTLTASGSLDYMTTGLPIAMTVTARHARPFASDQLSVNLDADLVLGGLAAQQMTAAGQVRINRAEIRIPERMPTSVAVLKFSNADMMPAPKATQAIGLDLTIAAPREIFIRGRGLNAELGGTVKVTGTTENPNPDGAFKLRHGQFNLAGQTLLFDQGSVEFDNPNLANPTLNFIANTSRNNFAVSLAVTGSAQQPKILLNSNPTLPPDEILANVLFGKGAGNLSPLELVQIASTLASLTGVSAGIDDPLEGARKRLSLDRLSVDGASSSLEAGRYIAPGVYLGAKQGISGTPQATIQVDVTKRLKLEGGIGSSATSSSSGNALPNSNSIGVIYQFEY